MNPSVLKQKHLPLRILLARLVTALLAGIVLLPVVYMVVHAFALEQNGSFLPARFGFSAFYEVFLRRPDYLVKFWNSLLLSVVIVAGQAAVSCLAGYGFARFQFPFKETIYFTVIVMMLMPYQVTLVSNFIVVKALHMDNTYWSIFLPGIFSPFGVFLMRQGFDSMPQELREAAMLEGCQELRILTKIALPVCRGQLTALVLLCFVDSWNMVEQPLVFLKETFRYPISVFLAQMDESRMDILCTCGILVTLPTLLLFLFCEEDLTDGIAKWKG